MAKHIFFSWQHDTPNSVGRTFLKSVLEDACQELATDATLDEAARELKVDSDTQGVAGQPPIAQTILNKIDDAAVVVADMTFTGKRLDGRPTPNPNVLIEYGWALKSLGYRRVISVMNTAYGEPNEKDLPFDLAHLRWPMTFQLEKDVASEKKGEVKARLTRELKGAIQASLATVPAPVAETPPPFPEAPATDGPARFRKPREALGLDEEGMAGPEGVFLSSAPSIWLRLMPQFDPGKRWPTSELLRLGKEDLRLLLRQVAGDYSYLRASDGAGIYRVCNDRDRPTDIVGWAFRTGEVWSVDTAFLRGAADTRLPYVAIEQVLTAAAHRYCQFLAALTIEGPYRWKAGLTGVRKRRLDYPPPPGKVWAAYQGPLCVTDEIQAEGSLRSEQSTLEALMPLFNAIFEECGIERPAYLSKD